MKSWRIRRRLGAGDREGLAVVERLRFRGLGGGDCCAEGASRLLDTDFRVTVISPQSEVFHAPECGSAELPASSELGGDGIPGWFDILLRSFTRCRGKKPPPVTPLYQLGGGTLMRANACVHAFSTFSAMA
jgi:hypothetical protein